MNGSTSAPSPAAEAIELENRDGASHVPAGLGERDGELRAALDRVRALASLDLDEFVDDPIAVTRGEPGDGGPLRVHPETRAALPARVGNSEVGDPRVWT